MEEDTERERERERERESIVISVLFLTSFHTNHFVALYK